MKGSYLTYFPQFCREPINDAAWYPGFTDWDLIRNLRPELQSRFTPARGFYNLDAEPEITDQFATLRSSQWSGMALYQYFFDGRFALDGIERFILSSEVPVPRFLTIWANESWSKRWIGKPNDLIIRQNHVTEEEVIQRHVERLAQLFNHPSYQKWDGRPPFVFYSVFDIPKLPDVLDCYRSAFRSRNLNPIFGFCVPYVDPEFEPVGFEFCVEFQPRLFFNVMRLRSTPAATKSGLLLKRWAPVIYDALLGARDRKLRGRMTPREAFQYSDYLALVEQDVFADMLKEAYSLPVVRGLFYSWNNFPRYRGGSVVVRHRPGDYSRFLDVARGMQQSNSWFLVNSWNEWSEGAALEPGQVGHDLFDVSSDH